MKLVKDIYFYNAGPILLMEFCEMPLQGWLNNNTNVTSDVLENMLNVTCDIANGVHHLHANKVAIDIDSS